MDTQDAIENFKMYRGPMDDCRVEVEYLEAILEAARMAPSGHNSQPCEFLVIDDSALIERIAHLCAEVWDDFLISGPHLMTWLQNFNAWVRWSESELEEKGDGLFMRIFRKEEWNELMTLEDEKEIRTRLLKMFGFHGEPIELVQHAPCLIITLVDEMRQAPDHLCQQQALVTAGAAIQNMRLAAYNLGLAVHEQSQLYDVPAARERLADLLGLPSNVKIVGAMRVGSRVKRRPAAVFMSNVRRPLSMIGHRNLYGNRWSNKEL